MHIGVPKEVKNHEYRVGLTPENVKDLCLAGHHVSIESQAGAAIGFSDEDYKAAGGEILTTAAQIYGADMIVKVKEPQASEYGLLRQGQILFAYLHLAADKKLAQALLASKCIGIAYETVMDERGRLPLLSPMSEIAGRLSIITGAQLLQKPKGHRGVLLSGVPGVESAHVVILGGGAAGSNAARMALGLEARVTILDRSVPRLYELDAQFGPRLQTLYSTRAAIEAVIPTADLVIGSVLIPGAAAPRLVTRALLRQMKAGSVFVDIAIDQGGCGETSRPTTHENPTFIEEDVIHYCVTNMPSAAARTATLALTNATQKYVSVLAQKGWVQALKDNLSLHGGLNVCEGLLTQQDVAHDLDLPFTPTDQILMGD